MRALLDTHAFLWWVTDDDRLSDAARETIADGGNEIYFSAASGWEIAIKARLGRLTVPHDLTQFMTGQIEQNGFLEIASLIRAAKADHNKTLDLLTQIGELVPTCNGEESSPTGEIRTIFAQIDKQIRRRIYLQDQVLFPLIERYSRPPRA